MAVDLRELLPGLHLLPLGISNAYLWRAAEGATLIDTHRHRPAGERPGDPSRAPTPRRTA